MRDGTSQIPSEMNLHVPQKIESVIELEQLSIVSTQINSPQHGGPIMGINQDSLVGAYLMTDDRVLLTRQQFMHLMMHNSSFDGIMPEPDKGKLYTGKQAISTIVPLMDKAYRDEDGEVNVEIKGGKVVRGQLNKNQLGAKSNSLVHVIMNDYGPRDALKFMDNEQRMVNSWLLNMSAFSVGVDACILDPASLTRVKKQIEDDLGKAYQLLWKAHENTMDQKNSRNAAEDFENQMIEKLNYIRGATKVHKLVDKDNAFLAMLNAGSKGKADNLAHISGCVGQQMVAVKQADGISKNQRIPYNTGKIKGGYTGRTLPCFHLNDDSPLARGFCPSSFLEGLSPTEFFFHLAGGREGLIDTAIKTADTGYLQRRMIKLMEDCKVQYDGTVRNSSRLILQTKYGCDGMDPAKLELDFVCKDLYVMDDTKLRQMYKMSPHEDWPKIVDAKARKEMQKDKELETLMNEEFWRLFEARNLLRNSVFRDPIGKDEIITAPSQSVLTRFPVNIARVIETVKTKYRTRKVLSELHPREVIEEVENMLVRLFPAADTSDYMKDALKNDNILQKTIIRLHLSSRRVLIHHRLSADMFKYVLLTIEAAFTKNISPPGDSVGIIAAQSLGEPTTQMTLNSLHFASSILLSIDGQLRRESIGEYIDEVLHKSSERDIEHHSKETVLAWVRQHDVRIPSCSKDGKISWRKVEAVTRHPVVNADGSNTLLKVTLHSGREIIATKAKSFLKRVNNKIEGVNGDSLKVGDYLPVASCLQIPARMDHLDMKNYLPEDKWCYDNGYVSTRPRRIDSAEFPSIVPLNQEWGALLGAYLAEGDATKHFISLTNGNPDFQKRITDLCDTYGFNWRFSEKKSRNEGFGASQKIVMSGSVISQLLLKLVGTGSAGKRIPAELLSAPKEFLAALIGAYYDGDGAFDKRQYSIRTYSISLGMLEDIQQILAQFQIQCDIAQEALGVYEKRRQKYPTASRGWFMVIKSAFTTMFKECFADYMVVVPKKKERLLEMNSKMAYSFTDMVPDIVTSRGTVTEKRMHLPKLKASYSSAADKKVIDDIMAQDIFYDKVESIIEVANDKPWVYDLTVEGTRNFNVYNGLALRDTFHTAGQSVEFNTVSGVPRIEELISVSKNPKSPQITIYLRAAYAKDEDRAEVILHKLQQTYLKDVTKRSEIVYDPSDEKTLVKTDAEVLHSYYNFMRLNSANCKFDTAWVLRIELDRYKMLERNIRMWEIQHKLESEFGEEIHCVLSDDNYANLMIRVRLPNDSGDVDEEGDQDVIFLLRELETSIMEKVVLRGVKGVTKAIIPSREQRPRICSVGANGEIVESKEEREIVIIAETSPNEKGTALLEVFKLPEVDVYRSFSNFAHEIYNLLGIEAARNLLMREIYKVFPEPKPNQRHIELLVDTMTCRGDLVAISRSGIGKLNVGPLARSSFEETDGQFTAGAAFAEIDTFKGVSAAVMLGQKMPGGTGACEILLDEDMIAEHAPKVAEKHLDTIPEESDQEQDEADEDPDLSDIDLGFGFTFDDKSHAGPYSLTPDLETVVV